jgi:signal transduction histidine kinase
MLPSLRSRLIFASVLWTAGLLLLIHMLTLAVMHVVPGLRSAHSPWMAIVGLAVMAAGFYGVRRSLLPFRRLREKLSAVRVGRGRRVEGVYPTEVQPLIDDLNALLENREKSVQRAVATAGDLAHGLKTPLALLAHEADRAAAAGNQELAQSILQQVERMSRQMTYHLARARAAASGTAGTIGCPVDTSAEALIRTLEKLYAGRCLAISSSIPADLSARVQREDLDEILGNLLDNGCKWAKSRIVLEAFGRDGAIVVTVADDGPGLDPSVRAAVLERGVRLDESAPGSGLGLAIVRDLVELYGGSIALDDSRLGGLQARIRIPAA